MADRPILMSSAPVRIQLSRKKGWRKPANAIVVARPSAWGNRYSVGETVEHVDGTTIVVRDRAHAVALHREWIDWQMAQFKTMREGIRHDLGGHDLCCWCPINGPCHADALLEIANR